VKPIAIFLAEKLEDLPSTGDWLLINNAAAELRRLQADVERLNTTPPAAPLQKPLTDKHIERIYHRYGGNMIHCARAIERAVFAAQRQWVGLTDEEIDEIFNNWPTYNLDHYEFAKAIEAKLKEKNI